MGQIVLQNNFQSLDALRLFLKKEIEGKHNMPKKVVADLDLALGELVTNIVQYGFSEQEEESLIQIDYKIENKKIVFTIVSSGKAYNPLEHEIPKKDASIKDKAVGSMEILTAKNILDDISYKRDGDKNTLTLVKSCS